MTLDSEHDTLSRVSTCSLTNVDVNIIQYHHSNCCLHEHLNSMRKFGEPGKYVRLGTQWNIDWCQYFPISLTTSDWVKWHMKHVVRTQSFRLAVVWSQLWPWDSDVTISSDQQSNPIKSDSLETSSTHVQVDSIQHNYDSIKYLAKSFKQKLFKHNH